MRFQRSLEKTDSAKLNGLLPHDRISPVFADQLLDLIAQNDGLVDGGHIAIPFRFSQPEFHGDHAVPALSLIHIL